MRGMKARHWIEGVAAATAAGLLLYAGWRGTWLPLQLVLGIVALRWLWRRAPLLLLAAWWWPGRRGD